MNELAQTSPSNLLVNLQRPGVVNFVGFYRFPFKRNYCKIISTLLLEFREEYLSDNAAF